MTFVLDAARPLAAQFRTRQPPRTGSLIVSIFGDSVLPRGGEIWLGSLIRVLAPVGVSERMVRSAVFRLVQDGVLRSRTVGRRSFYALTPSSREAFEASSRRIYTLDGPAWSGRWCLALVAGVAADRRAHVRRELGWLGFGQFGPDVLAHPGIDREALDRVLGDIGCRETVVLLDAAGDAGDAALDRLVHAAWDLDTLAAGYAAFNRLFDPLRDVVRAGVTPADAFFIRIFLVHEYRRVLLRDPRLPDSLLPGEWAGTAARQLCAALYPGLMTASERFIDNAMEGDGGRLPDAHSSVRQRFATGWRGQVARAVPTA
ncbi:MAG: phenylacetic acid degradation operon negative regulatory protein PaaX [Pseudomonadales bacterium]|nr:phenylacetic acid degradation operon negative regulatory protein PaaX [Pseudomonadales bacterium]